MATPSLAIQPPASSRKNLSLDTFSPVTLQGSYEYDRIIKTGEVLKRTRKTKTWKPVFLVLRPNLLSIYKDREETKLKHQVNLSELTAVARQKDPKRKEKHIFGLFSPSRNFHLEASSDKAAQEWVESIRQEARMEQREEETSLASPGGANTVYQGFERSIDANISPSADERTAGYSSSDAEAFGSSQPLPKRRERTSVNFGNRKSSHVEYSGAEHGSFSDFSDSGFGAAARMSALSLAHTEGRPSTSSTSQQPATNSVYGHNTPARPSMGARNPSQMSGLALATDENKKANYPTDDERVIHHGWIYLLKSKSGVRQWKKVWMVLRPKALAMYKNEEEYTALLILPFASIIDAVEIDAVSKSKTSCMQIISEERNDRFCAVDEDSLARWLGALKSLLAKRKAKAAANVS
ncbi:putative PH domain-containing protein PB16A4.02c [Pseudocercospora fuligena]|uniref:Putative PH domain-containing protein PB16A4.02c n=1 Tax=Pseudocercospora fuligena TaxID=685502 RepID=A0A8H6VE51_9PEZI|nr:putative PH domain-containing protein PB16A4.02c [Pseudocercospora fuligena]